MTTWLDALVSAWEELAKTAPMSRQYRSKLISADELLEVRAGMRAVDDAPCLMLQTNVAPEALFELGGMRLSAVPDDAGPLLVLSLEDSTRRDLFGTICADVLAAASVDDRDRALSQFLARLDAWRQFLRDRREGLSRPETVGLIGELLVLERLLAIDPGCLACWESPADGLHDFQARGHALEVKTGVGPAPSITISRLDQLDTAGVRRLDLLHVRLVETADGASLRQIVGAVNDLLPNEASRRLLENALLRRGLMPDDEIARSRPRVQVRTIDAYTVAPAFPRLLRSALPLAIIEATYTLEVRAISTHQTDADVVLAEFLQGADA